MNTQTLILVSIAVAAILLAISITWLAIRILRSQKLRRKFGPEYDYALAITGNRRKAEETLMEREKRVKSFAFQDLAPEKLSQYKAEWDDIQAGFVYNPFETVEKASQLITEVMIARGFPVEDFDQRAADISVLYPDFVSNYRKAHAIAKINQQHEISTEDLRQAMVYYHSLFEALLETEVTQEMEVAAF